MPARLTGLAPARPDPEPHVCRACGSTRDACRGYGDAWFCTPCVPPHLRFPWEAGYAPESAPPPPVAVRAPEAAAPLLTGLVPA